MAREFGAIRLSIWSDDDFRALSGAAQRLYFLLVTHSSLSHCGVADWRPSRLAAYASDTSVDDIQAAAGELIEGLFIVVDDGTEEVLVRSFVRHDELLKQPKMAVAMATAHGAVASPVLRRVIVHELMRLREDQPELRGWSVEKAAELLAKPSLDPTTYPFGKGSGKGSLKGIGKGKPNPSGKGSPTPIPAPTPKNLSPRGGSDDDVQAPLMVVVPEDSTEEKPTRRRKPARPLPEDWAPNDTHRNYAQLHDIDLDAEAFKFRNHAAANDRRQADWDASFRTWLGNANEFLPKRAARAVGDEWLPRHTRRDPKTGRLVER